MVRDFCSNLCLAGQLLNRRRVTASKKSRSRTSRTAYSSRRARSSTWWVLVTQSHSPCASVSCFSHKLSFPASTTSVSLVARTTSGKNVKIVDNEADLNAPLSKSLQASSCVFLRPHTLDTTLFCNMFVFDEISCTGKVEIDLYADSEIVLQMNREHLHQAGPILVTRRFLNVKNTSE